MSYKVLSLKWRPQTFEDVVGQDHVTQTLRNAFKKNRLAQGYIFTGPRGVGKTTMARIIAKGLNCRNPVDYEPCNSCSNCREITNSRNMDVLEIDGATNRGIDEIRNIRENIKFPPMNAPYKVYIIDEVHMLTTQAFNALLRTLEEPPPHGKFIMCTTDVHKMPATIISRCQRYDFNRISSAVIAERMRYILNEEKMSYDDESISAISRKADGSLRDALSLLDQVIAFAGDEIVFDQISKVLGLIPYEIYFDLTTAIREKNGQNLIDVLKNIRLLGTPLEDVVNGLNQHLRNLLIGSVKGAEKALEVNLDLQVLYRKESSTWDRRDLIRLAQAFSRLEQEIRRATQPQILLEMTLLKTLEMDSAVSIEDMLSGKSAQSNPTTKPYKIPDNSLDNISVKQPQSNIKKVEKDAIKIEHKEKPEKVEKVSVAQKQENDKDIVKDSLDLEYIKSNWHKLITSISSIKTSVAMVLEHTLPMDIKNRKLDVALVDQPRFSLDRLDRNKSLIEKTFEQIFGQIIRITFLFSDEVQEEIKHELPDAPIVQIKGDPVVNRVIELFDGEIIR